MVEVVGREGVGHRQVEITDVLVPPGRSSVQHRGGTRLTRLEFVLQELPQQRVVAVRPAVLVDQEGGAREVGEQLTRPDRPRDRIADRPVELLQDRRSGQEVDGARGQLLEHLRTQVVGDRGLVSRDVGGPGRTRSAVGHRCEDEQRRPSLRAAGQPGRARPQGAGVRGDGRAGWPPRRPWPAPTGRSREASHRPASGRPAGRSIPERRWRPASRPAGSPMNRASASRHARSVIRCASSMTISNGARAATADSELARPSRASTRHPTGSPRGRRDRAARRDRAPRRGSRTAATGSLSASSAVSQATDCASAARCASTLVLPYPGGATIRMTRCPRAARSRRSSRVRRTLPARWLGHGQLRVEER